MPQEDEEGQKNPQPRNFLQQSLDEEAAEERELEEGKEWLRKSVYIHEASDDDSSDSVSSEKSEKRGQMQERLDHAKDLLAKKRQLSEEIQRVYTAVAKNNARR